MKAPTTIALALALCAQVHAIPSPPRQLSKRDNIADRKSLLSHLSSSWWTNCETHPPQQLSFSFSTMLLLSSILNPHFTRVPSPDSMLLRSRQLATIPSLDPALWKSHNMNKLTLIFLTRLLALTPRSRVTTLCEFWTTRMPLLDINRIV